MWKRLRMWLSKWVPVKGYKVVLDRAGLAVSSWACGPYSRVTYAVGKKACAPERLAAKGYHLCAFLSEQDAFNLAKKRCQVYRAWLYDVHIPTVPICYGMSFYPDNLQASPDPWPPGTVMAKQIQLIKEVENA